MNKINKLAELILFIAEECKDDPEFGATKLNKILFLSDFLAYSIFVGPISNATYFHLSKGPAPKELLAAQQELFDTGRAKPIDVQYYGRVQKRIEPLKGPNTSIFTQNELSLVKEVIRAFRGVGGKHLSEWTHDFIPWLITEDKEEIPYYTAFTMFRVPVRRDGIIWGEHELKTLSKAR